MPAAPVLGPAGRGLILDPVESREPLSIRSARAADAEEVTRIYLESWNAGFGPLLGKPGRILTPALVARWRGDLTRPLPHRWWVAERQGAILGLAGIGPSRDPVDPCLGELDTIAVDPPHWRTGIGRELMSLALHYLKADGYCEAVVWTVAGYERGQGFYAAMAWRRDGGVRDEGRQVRYRRGL